VSQGRVENIDGKTRPREKQKVPGKGLEEATVSFHLGGKQRSVKSYLRRSARNRVGIASQKEKGGLNSELPIGIIQGKGLMKRGGGQLSAGGLKDKRCP